MALRLIPRRSARASSTCRRLSRVCRARAGLLFGGGAGRAGQDDDACRADREDKPERTEHIITIEDPIEYLFENKKSLIEQREVRVDTADFEAALESVFRQDVDVLMIGEMRTPETMATAVPPPRPATWSFRPCTPTTPRKPSTASSTPSRPSQQDQIRIQLAGSLAGIFSPAACPAHLGRAYPAYELLINNNAVAKPHPRKAHARDTNRYRDRRRRGHDRHEPLAWPTWCAPAR
jgi:twitching motility protein PilT